MAAQLRHLAISLLSAFAVLALGVGFWGIVERDSLTGRPENPRRILLEQRYRRGSILDRNGVVLAESRQQTDRFTRHYPYPDLAPLLGYVSPFYGLGGLEAAYDGPLHGDAGRDELDVWWRGVLGAPRSGRDVRLSIDARLQAAADRELADMAGAVVLIDVASGEILVLASHPAFDPNTLDVNWNALVADPRAPLLNRATQALYQPGGVLQPAILAAALQAGLADAGTVYHVTRAPAPGELINLCRQPPVGGTYALGQAFALGCSGPFAELGRQLGPAVLDQLFRDLRLFSAWQIGVPTAAAQLIDLTADPARAAAGQGQLTVTPLHVALMTAAIARQGEMPAPQLVLAVQSVDGSWQTLTPADHPVAPLGQNAAATVKGMMASGHAAVAAAGAEGRLIAWFSGFAPAGDPRYAIAVLLESGDAEAAARIGRVVLEEAARLAP